jgi:hypothetical protein
MSSFLETAAKKIPEGIRKIIVEEQMIDNATNVANRNSPMEYLFDVYAEFLDPSGEFQNFECGKCRHHVLENFKKLKPYL